MSKKVIINTKGSAELKEAIKIVAFEKRKELSRPGSSALIIQILENDPRIAKQLEKIRKYKKFPIGNQQYSTNIYFIRHNSKKIKMTTEISLLKLKMNLAINYLTLISACDSFILSKQDEDFYRKKKESAIKSFVKTMGEIFEDVITHSNFKP